MVKQILTTLALAATLSFNLAAQQTDSHQQDVDPQQLTVVRFGNVDMAKLFELMPESAAAERELADLQQAYDAELQKMGEEYQLKVTDFVGVQQMLDNNIAEARAQEIEQLQQRIQQFRQRAAASIREKREALTAPITEKVTQAIKTVGQRYGYTYIFDLNQAGILFFDPQLCDDVLPLVRAELGF